jgi:adenylate cyclase
MGDDEAATVKSLESYKGVMFSLIRQHRGRVVDSPGDNLLAEFGSVVDAVQCAVSIQKELQTRNADLPENRRMEFRIGINLGDVIEEADRIYGDGVNIAARLEALADPGGICVSKTAFDHIESKLPLGYEFLGEQTVKNIAKPVGAYKVLMETRVVDAKTKREAKTVSFWRRKSVLSIGIIVILAIVAFLYWNLYPREPSIEQPSLKPEQESVVPDVKEAPKSIAVLPFDDLSPKKDQEYFVDGLSEEILNAIDQIPGLTVKARTSSFFFKDQNKTIQEIAGLLGVDHILQGSVRKADDTLRITTRLIKVADVSSLWSETYDRELKDIFKIQEDIANNVADKLKLTLEALEQLGGTENVEAYELYLIAKGQGWTMDPAVSKNTKELLDAALALDPEFALAWADKAGAHGGLAIQGPANRAGTELEAGLLAAQKAIEFEPNLASGYYSLGFIKLQRCAFVEAELAYRKALEMPTETLSGSAVFITIHYHAVGNFRRARELLDKILLNDPLNRGARAQYLFNLACLDNIQGSEDMYKQSMALFGGQWSIGDTFITMIRLASSDVLPSDILRSTPVFNMAKEHLDSPEVGLAELRRLYNDGSSEVFVIMLWAAYFGDSEFAMDVLENTALKEFSGIFWVWLPLLHEVRQLPRFKEFVREIGLVDYWNEFGWPDICHPLENGDFKCD